LRIAVIGHGKMGAALLSQWRNVPGHSFFVIDPAFAAGAEPPRGRGDVHFLAARPAVADCQFDLLIVAVKPQMIDAILSAYRPCLSADGFIASVAAGCSIARLQSIIGAVPVIRIMPNLPAAIGAGVSGLCADRSATAAQRGTVEALMKAAGLAVWVDDEDKLDRLTAIAGSGPGYVFEFARSYAEAAEALGFSAAEARQLVLGTIGGTAAMALGSDTDLSDLRNSVTSKNGTTAAGLAAFNGDGALSGLLKATLDAAYARAIALR